MPGYLITHRDTGNPLLAPPPTCFTSLPTDIKLRIFESLHGVDLAKIGPVCSEFGCLASNPYLWKRKFEEAFPNQEEGDGINWKEKFRVSWENARKKRREEESAWAPVSRLRRSPRFLRFPRPLPPPVGGLPPLPYPPRIGGEDSPDLWAPGRPRLPYPPGIPHVSRLNSAVFRSLSLG